jgi:predicted RNase H-like HicB family nuclease
MALIFYPAIILRAAEGYSLLFPDLPGCGSAGKTMHECALKAEEALARQIASAARRGATLPGPSGLDAIEPTPGRQEMARILVRGQRPAKSVRVQITMDEDLLAQISRVTTNRSGFLAEAARTVLAARAARTD